MLRFTFRMLPPVSPKFLLFRGGQAEGLPLRSSSSFTFRAMSSDISRLTQHIVAITQNSRREIAQKEDVLGSVGLSLRIQECATKRVDMDGSSVYRQFVNVTLDESSGGDPLR